MALAQLDGSSTQMLNMWYDMKTLHEGLKTDRHFNDILCICYIFFWVSLVERDCLGRFTLCCWFWPHRLQSRMALLYSSPQSKSCSENHTIIPICWCDFQIHWCRMISKSFVWRSWRELSCVQSHLYEVNLRSKCFVGAFINHSS